MAGCFLGEWVITACKRRPQMGSLTGGQTMKIIAEGRLAVVGVGIVLLLSACGDPELTGIPLESSRVPDEQVETLSREYYSGVTERRREVIRSNSEWAAAWEAIYSNVSPKPHLPLVDFDESVVVLSSLGGRTSGGFSIDVTAVYRTSAGLHVVVQGTSPGPSCVRTEAETHPVVAVRVPRAGRAIHFVERSSVQACS